MRSPILGILLFAISLAEIENNFANFAIKRFPMIARGMAYRSKNNPPKFGALLGNNPRVKAMVRNFDIDKIDNGTKMEFQNKIEHLYKTTRLGKLILQRTMDKMKIYFKKNPDKTEHRDQPMDYLTFKKL